MRKILFWVLAMVLFSGAAPAGAGKVALLIGVSEYRNAGKYFESLNGPANDVELIRKEVLPILGYRPDQILTLTDSDATKENIRDKIGRFVGTKGADEWFFFFAGHGSQVDDRDGDEKDDRKDEVILPYDAAYDGPGQLNPSSVISDDELREWFRPLNGKKFFAVLDSCHSGTGFRSVSPSFGMTRSRLAPGGSFRGTRGGIGPIAAAGKSGAIESGDAVPEGHVYLYATGSFRLAQEKEFSSGRWQGYFSKAFADAVGRIAAASPDGNTYEGLYRTIDQIMQEEMNIDQTPYIEPEYRKSARLLQPFFDPDQSIAAQESPPQNRLPDIGASRTRVLIRNEGGGRDLQPRDFTEVKPYADIEFGAEGSGYSLYVSVDTGSRKVVLANENGFVLNRFSYRKKADLVKSLSKRIRHQYLKDLLLEIESKKGFPLTLETLYKGKPYDRNDFYCNQQITYCIKSEADVYLYVLSVDAGGEFNIYLPFELQPDNRIARGCQLLLPDKAICGDDVFLEITREPGEEILKLIAVRSPLQIRKAKIRDMGDEEWLTRVNFEEALETIEGIVSQLRRRDDWYAGTKRFMNYSRSEYGRMYPGN